MYIILSLWDTNIIGNPARGDDQNILDNYIKFKYYKKLYNYVNMQFSIYLESNLIKTFYNVNIMKTLFAHSLMDRFWEKYMWMLTSWKVIFSLLGGFVILFQTFWPSYSLRLLCTTSIKYIMIWIEFNSKIHLY